MASASTTETRSPIQMKFMSSAGVAHTLEVVGDHEVTGDAGFHHRVDPLGEVGGPVVLALGLDQSLHYSKTVC